MVKSYFFYVLYCNDKSLYAGYTTNLAHRLETHNKGEGAKYTRVNFRRPVRMIYAECFNSRSQAMSAEAKFKRLTRANKETYLANNGVINIDEANLVIVNRQTIDEEATGEDSK